MNDRLPAATDYRADIDGLRAVAVLSVMLYHLSAHWLPGGFVGVDIFFVISGFVVSASLTHAPSDRFHRFVAFFYARRLLRIGPALVLVLLTSVLAASLFIPRAWLSEFNERTALYAFFGLSNWVLQTNADTYFAPRAEFKPYTHTWSLGVEEQFYLAFPFLFFAWVKLRDSKRGRVAATAALALLGHGAVGVFLSVSGALASLMPAALPPTSMRVRTTAGAAASTVQKSRAFGSAARRCSPKLAADVVDVTSTTGEAPLTVTVSWRLATPSSTVASWNELIASDTLASSPG